MANDDVKEMLRAATALASASFEFDKAVADSNRFEARNALGAMTEAMNLANLASARMRRAMEGMPRNG